SPRLQHVLVPPERGEVVWGEDLEQLAQPVSELAAVPASEVERGQVEEVSDALPDPLPVGELLPPQSAAGPVRDKHPDVLRPPLPIAGGVQNGHRRYQLFEVGGVRLRRLAQLHAHLVPSRVVRAYEVEGA